MKTWSRLAGHALGALAALLVVAGTPAAGAELDFSSGHDVVVLGGQTVTIQPGQEVTGDLVVIGGTANVYGTVDGDAVTLGGRIYIAPEGRVDGDLANIGGEILNQSNQPHDRSTPVPGGRATPPLVVVPPIPVPPVSVQVGPPFIHDILAPYEGMSGWAWFYFSDAILTIIAFLLFPALARASRDNLAANPLLACVLGFFSPIIFAVLVIALCITIIGIPLVPLAGLALVVGYLVGKAAIAEFLGERVVQALRSTASPVGTVAIGAGILFLICALTGSFGIILWFAIAALSVGAAIPLVRAIRPPRRPPAVVPPASGFSPPANPAQVQPPAP
jgi:hypothetical protein